MFPDQFGESCVDDVFLVEKNSDSTGTGFDFVGPLGGKLFCEGIEAGGRGREFRLQFV